MEKMEDKQLVEKVLKGDRTAFATLISRYQRLVDHMVCKLVDDPRDREEVAQDIFIKVYENLGSFHFESKLSTWIATIAYRQAINALKKTKRQMEEDDLDTINIQLGVEDKDFEQRDFATFIGRWVEKLPSQYKAVLTLYHLEGMTYPEIVEITGMPEGTVKNYLFRARRKLRELLESQQEELMV